MSRRRAGIGGVPVITRRLLGTLGVLLLAAACVPISLDPSRDSAQPPGGGSDGGSAIDAGAPLDGGQAPDAADDRVVRPTGISTVALPLEHFTLPAALVGDAPLEIVTTTVGLSMLGSGSGLFSFGGSGFTRVSSAAVVGLVELDARTLVVAGTAALSIYDGTLVRSPLTDALASESIEALARRDDELWIGTSTAVYRYQSGRLARLASIGGGRDITTFDRAPLLIVRGPSGAEHALRTATATAWTVQPLHEEVALERAVPAAGDRVLGLEGGRLYQRVAVGADRVAWRPVSLSTSAADLGAREIEAVALDPASGALWVIDARFVFRLETTAGRVARLLRPASLGAVIAANATRDGALWLSDGESLVRMGNSGPPVTYAPAIARFASDNCLRCHSSAGPGRALETYAQWVANVDRAITQLERRSMPADGRALVGGTVELIRRWRADGLRP